MKDLIAALQILANYAEDDTYAPTHCEHDVLYVTCVQFKDVPSEDRKALSKLGFSEDRDNGGFQSYRFGSS